MKQIARRHGYHATFMCRPKLPNVFASGWHLHQSIVSRASGENAFMAKDGGEALSPFGRFYLAGLLEHARASTVFTTPTINGYKRYRSYSLAPDRAIWGRDNRGVMIRVLGGPGDAATRLENRIGEPAANPYLYMASQILSGLDGVDRKLDPGPSADTPYETKAALLPKSLREAVFALQDDPFFRQALGRGVRGLLRPHQERGDRAVSGRSVGLGAPRIFRDVLREARALSSSLRTQRPEHPCLQQAEDWIAWLRPAMTVGSQDERRDKNRCQQWQAEPCLAMTECSVIDGAARSLRSHCRPDDASPQIPRYRCCRSGSAINCSLVPLHTVRPRSMM